MGDNDDDYQPLVEAESPKTCLPVFARVKQ